jgi:hypothetical protein
MAKLMNHYAAIAGWERTGCVRVAILAPRLHAELGIRSSGLNEPRRQELHLSGYDGCVTALRSEVRVSAAGMRQDARARTGGGRGLPSAMREIVTSVQDTDRASLPDWDAARASACESALPPRVPGQPGEQEDHDASESPEHVLTTVVSDLSRQLTCYVGWNSRLGKALVFRPWPVRSMHVVAVRRWPRRSGG